MTNEVKNVPTSREITNRSWMEQASCLEVDTECWFDDAPSKAVRRHIRAVCSHCPVRRSCLSFALANNESSGAWGGFAMVELQPLKRRLAAGEVLSSVLSAGMQDRDPVRSSDAA
jgi:WhiB family transcriptional regulator, redox-sensing transcriptional regulator